MEWRNPLDHGITKKDLLLILSWIEGIVDIVNNYYTEYIFHKVEVELLSIEIALIFFSYNPKILSVSQEFSRYLVVIVTIALSYQEDDASLSFEEITDLIDLKKFTEKQYLKIKLEILSFLEWKLYPLAYFNKNLTLDQMKAVLKSMIDDPMLCQYCSRERLDKILF